MLIRLFKISYMIRNCWIVWVLCGLFCSCQVKHPQVVEGKLTLTEQDFQHAHSIELVGKWEFYWQKLWTPQELHKNPPQTKHFVKVPSSWTGVRNEKNEPYPAHGFATYRLFLNLPTDKEWGLYIPKIWSASKVWINGILMLERGKVTTSVAGYENQIVEKLIHLPINQVEIVVQVANYDIFIAGLVQPFRVGAYESMYAHQELNNGFTLMWLGCLLLMAVYHFILFFYRRKNTSVLYFGLACGLIALRILVFGEHYFYEYLKETTEILSFFWQSKLYYIASFLLVPVALAYIRSLYPDETHAIVVRACAILMGSYCTFVALAPPSLANATLDVGEVLTILFQLYLVYALFLAWWHKREDAFWQMLGIIAMIFASINDTLHAEEVELVGSIELTPTVFAIFLIMQCFIIARRFSAAFKEIEEFSETLEKKVEERTTELNHTLQLVETERQKSDSLLLNILPEEVAQELKEKGFSVPKQYELITVLFTDFKGFTHISEKISPTEVIENLNTCFLAFDEICDKYNLEKIKTIGDAYMCAGGVPIANKTNPVDVVSAGLAMQAWMKNWAIEKHQKGEETWELRLGIHSGAVVAGVVGKNKFAYDVWGDTVNLASRMESSGEVGKVNISETTYELVKHRFACTFRGKIEAKNKGELAMYFVEKVL
ncbi:MAG: hypothetical protein EAZ95_11580 [Bacteroidetes bacterium]|nr:MAG: hypothetical protein EAZ95_11580 [Bacteroidota bacterium]